MELHLVPGTKEWWRWRRSGIAAGDAPAIMGLSPHLTKADVLAEKLHGAYRAANYAMAKSLRLRPTIRELVERRTGLLFQPVCVQHDGLSWLRATLAGITIDGKVILRAHYSSYAVHDEVLRGQVPQHHLVSSQHAMAAARAAECLYASYSDHQQHIGDELRIVHITPVPQLILSMLEAEAKFWAEVEGQQMGN